MHNLFRIFDHPQVLSPFFKIISFGNIFFSKFFLHFGKIDHHTTRIDAQNSQIGLPLLTVNK